MKKFFIKIIFTALVLVCFSAPSFASKGGIKSIVDQSASSAFNALKNQTIEQLTTSLVNKQISDNEAKVSINIQTDESKESVVKREAKEASGMAAAESKTIAESASSSANVSNDNKLAHVEQAKDNANKNEDALQVKTAKVEPPAASAPSEESKAESSTTETTDTPPVSDSSVIPAGSLGIDVSQFNGNIDWKAVKDHGVKFAFIRVAGRFSVSASIYDDSRFEYNIAQAKANGIKVGVYFFTQAVNSSEAVEEARYAIEKIKPYGIDLPIVIDSESVGGGGRHSAISTAERTSVIKSFCEEVTNQGYTPMLYASTWWLNNKLDMSQLNGYKVWVAQYYDKVTYEGSYNVWQYTSGGSINGISGNVDCNRWYS